MSDWFACTVQNLVDQGQAEVKTGPFGTQLHASDYVESGIPVINVRNIGFGDIRPEKLEYISEGTAQRLSSHLLKPNDIVFGRKGAVERHAFIKNAHDRWFQGSDCLRLRVIGETVGPRFLSYCFLTESHKAWMMNQCSHGATMASLNQDIVKRIPLRLPPLETQRKIAAILSAYDDLIENNTRRIKILEEMAQAIYREWFVNFRFPGHGQVRMVDSLIGKVPEGWEVVKLADIAKVNARSLRAGNAPEVVNYIDIASVSTGSIDKVECLPFSEAPSRARRVVRHGDIIWSTVRPNRKSYSLILDPIEDLIASTGFAVISHERVPFTYLYEALTTEDFVGYLVNHATGAAYPAVNAGDFEKADIFKPTDSVLSSFHQVAEDMYSLRIRLAKKNQTLRQTRDLLLPKLISGEVNVSELDIDIKGAAT